MQTILLHINHMTYEIRAHIDRPATEAATRFLFDDEWAPGFDWVPGPQPHGGFYLRRGAKVYDNPNDGAGVVVWLNTN